MKKGTKGEIVLSACQIQATRLNRLEYRRLQNRINSLSDDLQNHLFRLHREEQGLKYHFANVVRVIKPNPAYQLWKQAHAHEIAQDEAKDLLESIKLRQKLNPTIRKRPASSSDGVLSEPPRPLLLLLATDNEKSIEPIVDDTQHLLRPKTSPMNKRSITRHRINPLIALLDECPGNTNNVIRQQQHRHPFETSSMRLASAPKFTASKLLNQHKASNLDVLYRMALQNQTAYKSVDKKIIDERKLNDKEFASQHRALKGSMRLARVLK